MLPGYGFSYGRDERSAERMSGDFKVKNEISAYNITSYSALVKI
jgi:hypothetical protein